MSKRGNHEMKAKHRERKDLLHSGIEDFEEQSATKAQLNEFKKLYYDHGLPYVCRELNIDSDRYNFLRKKLLEES